MKLTKCLWLVVIACAAILPVFAAQYQGQVKFGGLPLPGATITATQGEKTLSAVADPQGNYLFPDLPDGTWQLQVDMLGFAPAKQEVTTGTGLPGPSFELKMLPIDQIQAASPAPAPSVVVGPAPAVTSTTPAAQTAAPAATPSLNAALQSAAAKSPAKGKAATSAAPSTAFQRTDLSGSGAQTAPSQDPPPEVTSELNQRAADGYLVNGSAQNGAASNYSQNPAFGNFRKGGPRLYNGSFAIAESNSSLDAAPYSLTGQNTRTPFNDATVSFNFGGPIKIPHLLERNGPQFTINYQRIENRNSAATAALMPNAAERAGDFSQAVYASGKPVQIFDPSTGLPFANNMIPVSRFSQQALALLPYYPSPNFSGSSIYNYQEPLINNTHTDAMNVRINKTFKRKNFVSGIYAMSDTRSDSNSVFNFLDLRRQLGQQATVSYRRSFSPRFYGTVTYQFSRQSTQAFPFFSNKTNVSGAAGITGNEQQPLDYGPPSLQFNQSSVAGLNDANASVLHNQSSVYSYLGTWSHGRHNVQFGGDFRWQQFNTFAQQNPRGVFTFNGAYTQQVVAGVAVPGTGFDFADFLLGVPDQSRIAFGNADKYLRSTQPDLFIQDDWKISPGLSLTLGFRWEYSSPITEKYGRLVNLDVAPGYTAIAPIVASGNLMGPLSGQSYPASLIRPDRHEFRPLPGFAWRPFPASSMVVRGGYGISYNTQVYGPFANQMDQQSPLSKSLQVLNSAANPLTLANGFYAPANLTTNTIAVDPNFKIGYSQVWNLSVQRDLPGSLVLNVAYTGTKGTHLMQEFVPNSCPTVTVPACSTGPTGFTYYTSNGNSTRQAGTLDLRRRLHNGFTADLQYTYSKSIDDAAVLGGGQLGSPAQNWRDLEGERGLSSFDQRHLARLMLQYTTGVGVGGGTLLTGWRGRVAKDWTFVDQITLGTGLPVTPIYAQLIGSVPGDIRASYTGAPIYSSATGYFLNPLAVTAPGAGQWGNAGVGSITGPGQFSMSASMSRTLRLSDRFNLDLRIDASNPINHVIFANVNDLITSPQFGTLLNPNAMRSIVATMRLHF